MSRRKRRRFQYIRQKFPKRMQKKLVMLFVAIVLAFVGLIGKVTHINATNGEKYTKIVLDQQQYNSRTIPFKRGDIVDRNGTTIATSERVYNVILDAKVMLSSDKEETKTTTISQVKEVLEIAFEIESSVVDEIIEDNPEGRYNILKKKVSYANAREFEALIKETYVDEDGKEHKKYPYVSSIWLEEDYIRSYPYSTLASDVIGFTVAGNVGNAGIEASYNDILNGTDGREYGYLDTDSSLERTVKEAINGKTVMSTIDISLQSIVEKHILAFNEAHKNEARDGEGSTNTAVIIMNPNTGEILAEASYPNYDLNNPRDLSAYYSEEAIEAMSSEEKLNALNQLWRNFCVSDIFEPGSTVKPFTIATGLENGTLAGGETYNCTGSVEVGGWTIDCHKREGHGIQTLSDGIANSCNVVMMKVVSAIGVEEFCKYQSIFGFGQETGIDLPGEAIGLLYDIESMDASSLATNSFGQNFNVTMTQMVAAFSSLINGGNYYQPRVVKQILDENGNVIENKDPMLLKKTVSEESSKMLRSYMKQTMTEGTGKNAQVPGYSIGAKT
ncbi:MAG: penicillin-binding protein 2, partial [Tyzzerella sp.]|nr:penicillin-binding protein 2 [Tyzzerella sp.]